MSSASANSVTIMKYKSPDEVERLDTMIKEKDFTNI